MIGFNVSLQHVLPIRHGLGIPSRMEWSGSGMKIGNMRGSTLFILCLSIRFPLKGGSLSI